MHTIFYKCRTDASASDAFNILVVEVCLGLQVLEHVGVLTNSREEHMSHSWRQPLPFFSIEGLPT